jgi:hypothetical protein
MLGPGTKKCLGLLIKFGGHVNDEVNVEVPAAAAVQVFHSLMAQPVHGAVLTPRFDIEDLFLSERGHGDRGSEHRLREVDVRLVVQIVTVTLETWVALDA